MAIAVPVDMESNNRCVSKNYILKHETFSRKHLCKALTKGLNKVLRIPKNEFYNKKTNSNKFYKKHIFQKFILSNDKSISLNDKKNKKKKHFKEKLYISDLKITNKSLKKKFSNNVSSVLKCCQLKQRKTQNSIQNNLVPSTSTDSIDLCLMKSNKKFEKTKNQESSIDLSISKNKNRVLLLYENNLSHFQSTMPILSSIDSES